uniref:Uncharacterized protein n=1 Tax=Rhizophora mucronata TaxID=61149 RepID=A0A2P2P5Q0_RHIMU
MVIRLAPSCTFSNSNIKLRFSYCALKVGKR